jgi:hypothetical protein
MKDYFDEIMDEDFQVIYDEVIEDHLKAKMVVARNETKIYIYEEFLRNFLRISKMIHDQVDYPGEI